MPNTYTDFVDPFIGVDNGGNCLPGPYLPLSIARPGPDTLPPHRTTGYRSNSPIIRFSQNHVSGTGGYGRYGNIGLTPFSGAPTTYLAAYEPEDETASVGYYRVRLMPQNILAELTSTARVAVYRFTFPENSEANILLDAGAVVQVKGEPGIEQAISIGGFVEIISENEVIGRADCKGGWGHSYPYSVYFYAYFESLFQSRLVANANTISYKTGTHGPDSKAILNFGKKREVVVKIGISYQSIANARESVPRETAGKSFYVIKAAAAATWEKVLQKIRVTGGTHDQKKLFYTSFYRLLCMPSDLGIDDENPLWRSGVRHFTDYYTLWDSVRNANSLISLFAPELETDLLNCLLDIADHIGWLPDAWIAGHSAQVQGGSSADILLSEAALKGLQGIDYPKALNQMRKNNEQESPDPFLFGRYLKDYRDLGFVSTDVINCVSRHIEYTYQDWCIARLAELLGQSQIAAQYFNSAEKIWNLWRDDLKCFAPKTPDGNWINPFDPFKPVRTDYWNDPFYYEGTGHEWSLCALHVIPQLIERHGGRAAFVQHLDQFFESYMYGWKEMILHTPYLYHYANRPDKSAQRVRELIRMKYHPTRTGLPDNEDMGSHSAFYMCSTIGLYPVMGQDIYLLSAPFFERVEIELGNPTRQLTIEAPHAGEDMPFVSEAFIDGKPLTRCWLHHGEIANGATLNFKLASKAARQ
ncbi:GH92 family glycosyl hydrolase [candidate division KSB1 bacterium]|nr:GH92 family glycosyl hydrolase [candidate division KSB1 bacterium]